ELVANQAGLLGPASERIGGRREGADRIEYRIAEIVVRFAVELIGTASNTHVDHRTGRTTVFGAVVVGLDTKLRDGIRRWRNSLVGETLVGGAVGVVVDAVQEEVVELTALAV